MPALQQYFLPILIVVRTLITIQLLRASRDKSMPNLRWLALHFVLTCLGDVALTFLASRWLFALGQALGDMALVMFIHRTFYQDRKSPYQIFLGTTVIYSVVGVAIGLSKPVPPSPTPVDPVVWTWLLVVSYQAFKQISADKFVEDWVKRRYQLMMVYSVILLFFSPVNTTINNLVPGTLPSSAWSQVVAGLVQYLVWVMPNAFRRFLNRHFQAPSQDLQAYTKMSEEELLLQVQGN